MCDCDGKWVNLSVTVRGSVMSVTVRVSMSE